MESSPATAGTPTGQNDGKKRARLFVIASVVVLAVAGALTWALLARPAAQPPATSSQTPAPTPQPTDARQFERPADWSDYRPALHLTPAHNWMNDPQRPVLLDGVWHYYYLYNADYPNGNGTEWYHVTSTDLVHWKDEGVAIEKYGNGLGDIETGSTVIDVDNTAGFGAGTVIAIMTQQADGIQRQSLFYSTDNGYTFASYEANPVMENPGTTDFRDPKVIWDAAGQVWVMVLAEGAKIGFYTSPDLTEWTYVSSFERDDLGTLECPDLFQMSVDGDPANTRWVLAASAHGSKYDKTTGLAYWTGDWNGTSFTPDSEAPGWLDDGADFYAAVTWDDPRESAEERLASRYAIGWLNNWGYAGDLPTTDWQGGMFSIVRSIRLVDLDGAATLVSQPVDALSDLGGEAISAETTVLPPGDSEALPQPETGSYRLQVTLSPDEAGPAREVRLKIKDGGGHFVTVGYDFALQHVFIARDADAAAATMPELYRAVRGVSSPLRDGAVDLDIFVDYSSVEVFADGGRQTLSSLAFGEPGANGIRVESVDGSTVVRSLTLTPLAVAAPERQ
ncbi:levanase [Cryobacterium zongtaii]|uniref:Levanase n=1 Tax=Cryobacterium zongtaii TaxID=1259217 RepID=A0A2S3ZP57_9MICO|nr:glycoside hydrolase family 32 protein [Cryobacterium zongtaii]POH71006.1 levanase [Cryobacterium zongtaii]